MSDTERRSLLATMAAALVLGPHTCGSASELAAQDSTTLEKLMREHGLLRRVLLIYAESARRLAAGEVSNMLAVLLSDGAAVWRTLGHDHHERGVEQRYIFRTLNTAGGKNAALAGILQRQHDRGREITDYIATLTSRGRLVNADAKPLATALTAFVRMYGHHLAIEDTVIFPAWRAVVPKAQYQDLSARFQELERQLYGKDGFASAGEPIERIEQALGLSDLAKLTAPAPKLT